MVAGCCCVAAVWVAAELADGVGCGCAVRGLAEAWFVLVLVVGAALVHD